MRNKVSERCALAALIALVVYCLACVYPVAWSPDSKQVIFPVFGKRSFNALVITDLSGKAIREVARAAKEGEGFSPAAWSPDGKWIAYCRYTGLPEDGENKPKEVREELMLQDAESGKERSVWAVQHPEDAKDGDPPISMWHGPAWSADSASLTVARRAEGKTILVVLGFDGKVKREIALPGGDMIQKTVSPSPDGAYVAYLEVDKGRAKKETKDKAFNVRLFDMRNDKTNTVGEVLADDNSPPRPMWSADSRFVYIPADQEKMGRVKQVEIATGEEKTVWEKPKSMTFGLSVGANANILVVDYLMKGGDGRREVMAMDVVDLASGAVRLLHADDSYYSTAVSPDGKWVAFCPIVKRENEKEDKKELEETNVGVIVSAADGATVTFFIPDPKLSAVIPEVAARRLAWILTAAGIEEGLEKAGMQAHKGLTPEQLDKAEAELDKAAAGEKSPLVRESIAFNKARLHVDALDGVREHADAARKAIDAFLKAYPNHRTAPWLEEKLKEALAPKSPAPKPAGPEPLEPKPAEQKPDMDKNE